MLESVYVLIQITTMYIHVCIPCMTNHWDAEFQNTKHYTSVCYGLQYSNQHSVGGVLGMMPESQDRLHVCSHHKGRSVGRLIACVLLPHNRGWHVFMRAKCTAIVLPVQFQIPTTTTTVTVTRTTATATNEWQCQEKPRRISASYRQEEKSYGTNRNISGCHTIAFYKSRQRLNLKNSRSQHSHASIRRLQLMDVMAKAMAGSWILWHIVNDQRSFRQEECVMMGQPENQH